MSNHPHKWRADTFVKSKTAAIFMQCTRCGAVDGTPEGDRPCLESPATLRDLAELRMLIEKVRDEMRLRARFPQYDADIRLVFGEGDKP